MKSKVILLALIIALLCNSCTKKDADSSYWKSSTNINTIDSYKDYLKNFPNGKFKSQADSLIQVLVWEDTKKQNTPELYEKYLSDNPNGFYKTIADSLFEESLWKEASTNSNMEYYIKYKTKFPNGKYVESVKKYINLYLIEFDHVGYLKLNMNSPFGKFHNMEVVRISETVFTEEGEEIQEIPYLMDNDKKLIEFSEYNNIIWRIDILNDKFRTKKNIGVNSTIEEFVNKYYEYLIIEPDTDGDPNIFIIAKDEDGVRFQLNSNDLIGSGSYKYDLKDFKKNAKIQLIRLTGDKFHSYTYLKSEVEERDASIESDKQAEIAKRDRIKQMQNVNWVIGSWNVQTDYGPMNLKILDSHNAYFLGDRGTYTIYNDILNWKDMAGTITSFKLNYSNHTLIDESSGYVLRKQ